MKILVAHDGSPKADKALETAAEIAGKFGGSLVVVSVVPDLCLSSEEIGAEGCELVSRSLSEEAGGAMRKVKSWLSDKGLAAELLVKEGRPADGIQIGRASCRERV